MEEGGRASLVCWTSLPWLVCTWHLLPHQNHCALLTEGQVRPVDCQAGQWEGEEEVEVVGNSSWCGLEVGRVRRQRHAGLWTCSLSSLQTGRLVTSHSEELSLEVLSRGSLSLVVETNNKHRHYLVSNSRLALWSLILSLKNSSNVTHGLTISTGGIINISCHLENAFPETSFSWRSQNRNNESGDGGIISSSTVRPAKE